MYLLQEDSDKSQENSGKPQNVESIIKHSNATYSYDNPRHVDLISVKEELRIDNQRLNQLLIEEQKKYQNLLVAEVSSVC